MLYQNQWGCKREILLGNDHSEGTYRADAIPFGAVHSTPSDFRQGKEVTASIGRLHFAIVEDDTFMAELVCDMLIDQDAQPQVFSSGLEFLKSADRLTFHTILLDLSLPDIDGFDLMEKLAAQGTELSVLLMSGHNEAVLSSGKLYGNGLGLNVRGVLCKPFTKAELLAALGLAA